LPAPSICMAATLFSRNDYGDIVGAAFAAASMKYFSRVAVIFAFSFALVSLCVFPALPAYGQLTWDKAQKNAQVAVVQSVEVIPGKDEVTVEILASRAITPEISRVEGPPRLVIDLPNTVMPLRRKRFGVRSDQISGVRVDQYSSTPQVARAVVDLLAPVSYVWQNLGDRLVIHIRPSESAKPAFSVPAFMQAPQPVAVPVTQTSSGAVMLAGSSIAGGSSVTAGSDTAILHLSRGGEVRVCPGTTVSVTPSQNGRDLMLAMNTGALEAHYSLQTSADSMLTPDFRMMLAGPGEFDFAISSDAHGNTCVRSLPGNTASIIVSELMGDGTYQVRPTEQVVFHAGNLAVRDANAPLSCGCPPSRPETMLASKDAPGSVIPGAKARTVALAQSEDEKRPFPAEPTGNATQPSSAGNSGTPHEASEVPPESRVSVAVPSLAMPASENLPPTPQATSVGTSALPPAKPNETQVEVDAPFVFRASDPSQSSAAEKSKPENAASAGASNSGSAASQPAAMVLPPAPERPAKPTHHGFMGKIKGFFSSIFR
jgi:AMIN domain-containing protein